MTMLAPTSVSINVERSESAVGEPASSLAAVINCCTVELAVCIRGFVLVKTDSVNKSELAAVGWALSGKVPVIDVADRLNAVERTLFEGESDGVVTNMFVSCGDSER